MNLNLISKRLVDNWYINWMFQYWLFCLVGPIHSHKLIMNMTKNRWMYNRTNEEFYRFIFETNGYRCEDVCLFILFFIWFYSVHTWWGEAEPLRTTLICVWFVFSTSAVASCEFSNWIHFCWLFSKNFHCH